ncbi:XopAP family type III secretion system effector [Paracidovorax citrulli]|uniref:XopAP family type III secretion system effector n=1 Tax=Paracidovorax citrulli TaxID=80869 RepID=UPI001D191C53|nr:XopAP family type III secretion system effector [Paracidovorax citrulli]UEG44230.1 lipase [Paracidovorax citrulli]
MPRSLSPALQAAAPGAGRQRRLPENGIHLPPRAAPRTAADDLLATRPGPAHPAPPRNVAHPPGGIDLAQVDLGQALACVDLPTVRAEGASGRASPSPAALERMRREVLECMRALSGHAYTEDPGRIPSVGGLGFEPAWSTPALRCWKGATQEAEVLVLAFSGTRMDDRKDLLCDLSSQWSRPHRNPFGEHLPTLGAVGMGWQDRWHEEARTSRADGRTLRSLLTTSAAEARNTGRMLSISVTGHSLGAAVGILAGVDIANFLRHREIDGQVSTYAFNPPRIAPDGIEGRFQEALELRLGSNPGMRFALRQFVREQDPIQSMPLHMHHPAWPHPQGSRVQRTDLAHGMIATCTDRPASRWNPAVNHDLSPWQEAIGGGMSRSELRSLFR